MTAKVIESQICEMLTLGSHVCAVEVRECWGTGARVMPRQTPRFPSEGRPCLRTGTVS